jgi:hypothetical protein
MNTTAAPALAHAYARGAEQTRKPRKHRSTPADLRHNQRNGRHA